MSENIRDTYDGIEYNNNHGTRLESEVSLHIHLPECG